VRWDADRLAVSAGVVPAREEATGQDYAPEARIARAPYRPMSLSALSSPAKDGALSRTRTVGVIRIGDGLLATLRREGVPPQDRGGMSHRIGDLCEELSREWEVREAPSELNLSCSRAGLRTVTRDPVSGRFVGLHVDTFHDGYDDGRTAVGNRVSVNIGMRPRFFFFVPLTFRSLHARAGGRPGRNDTAAEFLRANPWQPVVRLRIDPGDAYIAPTESIVHDAGSLPGTTDDLHVTGRGVLDPRPR
jgi:hypothetical protein